MATATISRDTVPTPARRFARLLEDRRARASFDVRLGCELVHVSTSEAVDALVARFEDLDAARQAKVLENLERAG